MHTRSLIIAGGVALAALACRNEPTAPTAGISRVESAARPLECGSRSLRSTLHRKMGRSSSGTISLTRRGMPQSSIWSSALAARWGGAARMVDRRKVRVDGHAVARWAARRPLDRAVAAGPAGAQAVGSTNLSAPTPSSRSSASLPTSRPGRTRWRRIPPGRAGRLRTPASTTSGGRCRSTRCERHSGSTVVGWYTLPQPMARVTTQAGSGMGGRGRWRPGRRLRRPPRTPDVYFPRFLRHQPAVQRGGGRTAGWLGWLLDRSRRTGQTKSRPG